MGRCLRGESGRGDGNVALGWVELRADSPDLTIGGFQGTWTGGVLGVGVMAVKGAFFVGFSRC